MNEILLYLSLKYSGDWIAIYDSIQQKQDINPAEITQTNEAVDSQYVTLIDPLYCQKLTHIYQPPFGIFSYGLYELVNKNCITVYADLNDQKQLKYLDYLNENNVNFIWFDLSNNEMQKVLSKYKTNNIFCLKELRNKTNKTFRHLIDDPAITTNNAFVSEIWEVDKTNTYARQAPQRMYIGLSRKILFLEKPKNKDLLMTSTYCAKESLPIYIKEDLLDESMKKSLKNNEIYTFKAPQDLSCVVTKQD